MPEKKRPGTSDDRDRRRTDSAGAPVRVIEDFESKTPPPQHMPVLPRTVSPEIKALEQQVQKLTAAVGDVWDARHTKERLDAMRTELSDNTRSTIRMEAVVDEMVLPLLKEQLAKLDTCMHHIAASGGTGAALEKLAQRFDAQDDRLAAIETEQKLAAERFEAHDARDAKIEATANDTRARVVEIEKRLAIADNTAKVRKLVAKQRSWWLSAKGVSTVIGAVVAGVIAILAATAGGCL